MSCSTLFTHLPPQHCVIDGGGIQEIVNFTEYFVGDKSGGPVSNSSWSTVNTSFHGPQEIMGDKFYLCARSYGISGPQYVNSVFVILPCVHQGDGAEPLGSELEPYMA